MPPEVVQRAVDKTPNKFTLFGREPSHYITLGGDSVCFGPGGFAVFVEDLQTRERRRALRQDLREHLCVSDFLPGCEFNHVNVFPSELPEKTADLHIWADALVYQTKPIMSENYSTRSVDLLVEMASAIRGSREAVREQPSICLDVCVLSPLTHDSRQVELLLAGARYGIPISINSGPIAGGTAPITLAGLVSQANAEILSAIVIAYAEKPGAPVLYGSWGRHMDMRYGSVTMGGPEFALLKVCTAQMGRFYSLPTRGGGVLSDSLLSDTQSGYEKMLTTIVPALGKLNYISGMGLNETENQQSLAQLVIDNEIVLMVKRLLRGIEVDHGDLKPHDL
jgi:trimethylamine--corrinoid protein Co-methyltransferase